MCHTVALFSLRTLASFVLFIHSNPLAATHTNHLWIGPRELTDWAAFFPSGGRPPIDTAEAHTLHILRACSRLLSFNSTECLAPLPLCFPRSNRLVEMTYCDVWGANIEEIPCTSIKRLYIQFHEYSGKRSSAGTAIARLPRIESVTEYILEDIGELWGLDTAKASMASTKLMAYTLIVSPQAWRGNLADADARVTFTMLPPSKTHFFDSWMERTTTIGLW
jgi:hypothetical protein